MAIRRPRGGQVLAVSLLVVATATAAAATPAAAAPATGQIRLAGTATAIPDSYIVVLKAAKTARVAQDGLAKRFGGSVRQDFGAALNGFEARMSESAAKRLAADPNVAYVRSE